MLGQCAALTHLNISYTSISGEGGAKRLAGVLGHCRELVHLNLRSTVKIRHIETTIFDPASVFLNFLYLVYLIYCYFTQ